MNGSIKLVVTQRRAFAEGAPFGDTGAYERIDGVAHFSMDPAAPAHRLVHDIDLAERATDGNVHFSAEFFILKPTDSERGNGALLFEFPNRGSKRCLQFFNDAPANNSPIGLQDAGNATTLARLSRPRPTRNISAATQRI